MCCTTNLPREKSGLVWKINIQSYALFFFGTWTMISVIYVNIHLPHPSSRIHSDFGHESSFIECQLLENCQIVFCTLHYFILDLNQILKVYQTEASKMLLKYLFALSSTKSQHLNWSNLVFLQKLQDHLESNFRNTKDFWLQLQYFHEKFRFKY